MMIKKAVIILLTILMAFTSCSNDPNADVANQRGSLRVVIPTSRTLLPETAEIASYEVILKNDDNTFTASFNSTDIEFSGILIGTYSVTVNGKDSLGQTVMTNKDDVQVTIKANETSSCIVSITYILSGSGSVRVTLSWDESEITNGPFKDALNSQSLGFLAWNADENKALGSTEIKWVDDVTLGSYVYEDSNIPATGGTNIIFKVYTDKENPDLIAETFPTVIQVYQNVTSIPDANEENNFKINKDNTISYLRNVSKAAWDIDSENPESILNISWTNPTFSSGIYPITVDVTIKDENGNYTETQSIYVESKDGTNSASFTGLVKTTSYSFSFKVNGSVGNSDTKTLITGARTKTPVTGIAFTSDFASSYTAGDSVLVGAVISPEDATYTDYTVEVIGEGATVSDKSVTFNSHGDYTIKITSTDNPEAIATKDVMAALQAPSSFSSSKVENGLNLYWSSVSGATGYTITKTTTSGVNADETIELGNVTEYTDLNLYTGSSYSYTIKAVTDDGEKFTSALSNDTVTYSSEPADFTVIVKDIDRPTLTLEGSLGYVVESESARSFTVAVPEIANATNYEWRINGKTIKSGSYSADIASISINGTTDGLNWNSEENTNSLTLIVTLNGVNYSTTSYFHGILGNPGNPILSFNENNTVYYNSEDDRSAQITVTGFTNSPDYEPSLAFSSSNPEIISVNGDGVVTANANGEATITVTVASTGESSSITLKTYIPVETITIEQLPVPFLIYEKTGVTVEDETYKSFSAASSVVFTGLNGGDATLSSPTSWESLNPEYATVSEDGIITAVAPGTATIKVYADNAEASFEVKVLEIDLTVDGETLTGGSKTISELSWNGPYALSLKFSDDYYTVDTWGSSPYQNTWCIDGDTSKFSGNLSFDVTSNDFIGEVDRGSDASSYTVTAVIQERNSANTIAIVSFTARS